MARPPSNILSAKNRQRLLNSLQARASAGDVRAAAELVRLSFAHEKLASSVSKSPMPAGTQTLPVPACVYSPMLSQAPSTPAPAGLDYVPE